MKHSVAWHFHARQHAMQRRWPQRAVAAVRQSAAHKCGVHAFGEAHVLLVVRQWGQARACACACVHGALRVARHGERLGGGVGEAGTSTLFAQTRACQHGGRLGERLCTKIARCCAFACWR
jgi:hypothetical protein